MSATTLTRREGRISLWRDCLRNRTFLAEVLFTIVLATVTLRICSFVLVRLELRPGAELDDPILRHVGPIRLTWFTFAVLWSSVFSSVYFMTRFPHVMVVGFQAAVLILFFRTVTIYLIPLRPLPTIIPLADPVVSYLGPGKLIIKDLLFSGNTSVMFLLFLAAQKTWLRVLYLTGTNIYGR